MRPVRAISPTFRVRRSVMNRTVHASVSFDVLIALALASPFLSMVIARHVGTAFTVSRARRSKVSALMALFLSEVGRNSRLRLSKRGGRRVNHPATYGRDRRYTICPSATLARRGVEAK